MEDSSDSGAPRRAFRTDLAHCLWLTGIIAIAVLSIGYLLPTAVLLYRRKMTRLDRWLFFLFNIGAGWTLLGWFVALRIAQLTNDEPSCLHAYKAHRPRLRPRAREAPAGPLALSSTQLERRRTRARPRRVNAGAGWIRYRPVSEENEEQARLLAARRSWRIGVREPPTPPGLSRIERFAMLGLDESDQRWPRRGLRA
jgi:hypothetical protein